MRARITLALALLAVLSALVSTQEVRPLILVTNDDGIDSTGLAALVAELVELGEVVVVAPRENRSGVGHGITYKDPIAYGSSGAFEGVGSWWVDALPASCVRWALDTRFAERRPDLVVSGINRGSNMGAGVYYSGTVGAAREGALGGVPSIAASMDTSGTADYRGAARCLLRVARAVLAMDRRPMLLNVNFPAGQITPNTPVVVTRLTDMRWTVDYHDRQSPRGGRYFWITYRTDRIPAEDSDAGAVMRGCVSVTPLILDTTARELMEDVGLALVREERVAR